MSLLVVKLETAAGAVQVAFTQCDVARLLSTHCPMKKRTGVTKMIQKNSSSSGSSTLALDSGGGSNISKAVQLVPSEDVAQAMEVDQPIDAPVPSLLALTSASSADLPLPVHPIPLPLINHGDDTKMNKKKRTKRGCRAGKLVKSRQLSSLHGRPAKTKGRMDSVVNVPPGVHILPPPPSSLYAHRPHASSAAGGAGSTAIGHTATTTTTLRGAIYPPVVYPYHIPHPPSAATSYPPAASSSNSSSSSHNHGYNNRNTTTHYPLSATAQLPGLGLPIPTVPPHGIFNTHAKKRKRPSHPVSVSVGDRLVARIKANAALDTTVVWDKPRGKSSPHQRRSDQLSEEKQQQQRQQAPHQDVFNEGSRGQEQSNIPFDGQDNGPRNDGIEEAGDLISNGAFRGSVLRGGVLGDTVDPEAEGVGAARAAAESSSSEDENENEQDENEQDENTRSYYSQEDWVYKRKKRQKTKSSAPFLLPKEGQRQGGGQGQRQGKDEREGGQVQDERQGQDQSNGMNQGQRQGRGGGHDGTTSRDALGEPTEEEDTRPVDDGDVMTIDDPNNKIIASQAASANTPASSSSSSSSSSTTSSRVSIAAFDNRLTGSDDSPPSTGNPHTAPPVPSEVPPAPLGPPPAPPVVPPEVPLLPLTDPSSVSSRGPTSTHWEDLGSTQSNYPPSETSSQWHRNVLEGESYPTHDMTHTRSIHPLHHFQPTLSTPLPSTLSIQPSPKINSPLCLL